VADVVLGNTFTQPAPVAQTRAATQQGAASVALTPAEVAAMAGRYYSDELNATYELIPSGTTLVLHRSRAGADTLRALDHQTLRGAGVTLRFARPTTGGATANFTLDNGRARGLEFSRAAR
jgi:hypothetical protein